ncbi:HIT family protein [Paenibacillus sp. R14(2021)]|uniref:HIT family protein n=1 Tax=Paenibacillus sp. R14(2021) TaxID=2859228 RepID=UPI001C61278F|nr:HIT family protein [Paenibacillus sp. R14(2021)]
MNCLGCRLANHLAESQVVWEDDLVTCLLDIDPLNEGHTLILPKAHVTELDDIDEQTMGSIMQASIRISKALKAIYKPDGISVIQNGGIFNDLGHYHMHVFPRYKDDGFSWNEPGMKSSMAPACVQVRLMEELSRL